MKPVTRLFRGCRATCLAQKSAGLGECTLNVAIRVDHADGNTNSFKETNEVIGDELWAMTPALSFRPSQQTIFRLNYRYQWQTDLLNNPPSLSAAWKLGVSTYF